MKYEYKYQNPIKKEHNQLIKIKRKLWYNKLDKINSKDHNFLRENEHLGSNIMNTCDCVVTSNDYIVILATDNTTKKAYNITALNEKEAIILAQSKAIQAGKEYEFVSIYLKDELTWQNIFNSNHKFYGHIDNFINIVLQTGYSYVLWNDQILKITEKGKSMPLGLTKKDIK